MHKLVFKFWLFRKKYMINSHIVFVFFYDPRNCFVQAHIFYFIIVIKLWFFFLENSYEYIIIYLNELFNHIITMFFNMSQFSPKFHYLQSFQNAIYYLKAKRRTFLIVCVNDLTWNSPEEFKTKFKAKVWTNQCLF